MSKEQTLQEKIEAFVQASEDLIDAMEGSGRSYSEVADLVIFESRKQESDPVGEILAWFEDDIDPD